MASGKLSPRKMRSSPVTDDVCNRDFSPAMTLFMSGGESEMLTPRASIQCVKKFSQNTIS
jgi:hypothetical protein